MMPISTPPNAIVYSNNSFKINFMVKNGLVMNFTAIITIAAYTLFLEVLSEFQKKDCNPY